MGWSFDQVLERTERAVDPADQAIVFGDHVVAWGALKARTDRLAAALLAAGAVPGDKVAHYLRNGPEYLETAIAGFKAGLTHVNVNYRYTETELFYLFDQSDAAVIVYEPDFAPLVAALRPRLDKVKLFVETGGGPKVNAFAARYEDFATGDWMLRKPAAPAEHLLFIYTGGTTGLPKGVMWRHEDLWAALGGGAAHPGAPKPKDLDAFEADLRAGIRGARLLLCPPLMHGAGFMMALMQLLRGGTVIMAAGTAFDPEAVLGAIAAHRPETALIVGDAFGRPLAQALAAAGGKYDTSSLQTLISSGAMWSAGVKDALVAAMPQVRCLDALGSSEVVGLGISVGASGATRFRADPLTRVIAEDGSLVAPGSGLAGRIARAGPVPLGYYNDPVKTAQTFVDIDGVRHAVPGDLAMVEADGAIKLLGRGNLVINTGGEKVFVEEVEEALKSHKAIDDALVFGVADPVWGQAVTAVVQANAKVTAEALRAHLALGLARYKLPKRIVFAGQVPRGPNGKANYPAARALSEEDVA